MLARYCSGRKLGSLKTFRSTGNAGPFAGEGPPARSFDEAYWFGREGTEGTGGAFPSKSEGRALNLEEYRRLTRSEVCKTCQRLVKTPDKGGQIPSLKLGAFVVVLRMRTSRQCFVEHLQFAVLDRISVWAR
jgi:hypothetical protein